MSLVVINCCLQHDRVFATVVFGVELNHFVGGDGWNAIRARRRRVGLASGEQCGYRDNEKKVFHGVVSMPCKLKFPRTKCTNSTSSTATVVRTPVPVMLCSLYSCLS